MHLARIGLLAALAGVVLGELVGTGVRGAAERGATADCEVCTKAQQCCEAVAPGGRSCTFSAATCSSMVGDARSGYVNACLTFLSVTREAWKGNPPPACR